MKTCDLGIFMGISCGIVSSSCSLGLMYTYFRSPIHRESHFDDVGMLTAQMTIMMYWLVLIFSYLYNVDERLIVCHCQLSLLVENNSRNDADNDGT